MPTCVNYSFEAGQTDVDDRRVFTLAAVERNYLIQPVQQQVVVGQAGLTVVVSQFFLSLARPGETFPAMIGVAEHNSESADTTNRLSR